MDEHDPNFDPRVSVPDIEEDELFGLFKGMFSVVALWGVIAIIAAIAGVIWSMP